MSMIRCEIHDRVWDSDEEDDCPSCIEDADAEGDVTPEQQAEDHRLDDPRHGQGDI